MSPLRACWLSDFSDEFDGLYRDVPLIPPIALHSNVVWMQLALIKHAGIDFEHGNRDKRIVPAIPDSLAICLPGPAMSLPLIHREMHAGQAARPCATRGKGFQSFRKNPILVLTRTGMIEDRREFMVQLLSQDDLHGTSLQRRDDNRDRNMSIHVDSERSTLATIFYTGGGNCARACANGRHEGSDALSASTIGDRKSVV